MDNVDDSRGDKICRSEKNYADYEVRIPYLTFYQAEALLKRYPGSVIVRKGDKGNDRSKGTNE